eukprot:scaffold32164_cov20-Tisochrysis_lutea.AAC.7
MQKLVHGDHFLLRPWHGSLQPGAPASFLMPLKPQAEPTLCLDACDLSKSCAWCVHFLPRPWHGSMQPGAPASFLTPPNPQAAPRPSSNLPASLKFGKELADDWASQMWSSKASPW